ncbi:MAG TPA: DNRLRE domain-containing protein [Candidatus Binatia bacterium]|nr:DNRLRE domain-containing protein [Candidatus Binatia bacterium]
MKIGYAALALGLAMTISTGSAASLTLQSQSLTAVRTCVLSGYPSGATETDDYVGSAGGNGTGTIYLRSIVSTGSNGDRRIYVMFTISGASGCSPALPSTATVLTATVRLYMTATPGTGVCRTEDAFRVGVGGTTYWPNSLSWTATMTWAGQPAGGNYNNPPNNPPTVAPSGLATVGPGCGAGGVTAPGYVAWTVTSDVQGFVSGTIVNDGWMIRDDVEQQGTSTTANQATLEGGAAGVVATEAPELVISYVDVP